MRVISVVRARSASGAERRRPPIGVTTRPGSSVDVAGVEFMARSVTARTPRVIGARVEPHFNPGWSVHGTRREEQLRDGRDVASDRLARVVERRHDPRAVLAVLDRDLRGHEHLAGPR